MNNDLGFFLNKEGYLPDMKKLSPEDVKLISKVFYRNDIDFKGYLTRSDFKVACVELLGYKPCKSEADRIISTFGEANSKGLTLEQFQNAMSSKLQNQDEDEMIRETFLAFDKNCQGFLREDDVANIFKQVAPHLPSVTVATVFRELDQDSDGRVSFRDFQMMMKYDFDSHL